MGLQGGRVRTRRAAAWMLALATALIVAAPGAAQATDLSGALVGASDCIQHELPRNDDDFTSSVAMPFAVDFYGQSYQQLWVNNNGNVTFDGPLGTYTPFGLQATMSAIIAPYFADVDTRASGSQTVKYGWGETTFEGRRAFCANWVDVGYYSSHADKLNSFQLLLVDRSNVDEGDFDIVFNYGSVTWETGDASGGSGGLGGESARVGFANGDGTRENSYELPGSGVDGSLLDASPRGLINNSIGSSQRGRYVYPIRNGLPAPNDYVAMGDSFQSGEGAFDYEDDTDNGGTNECHRSEHAYPRLLGLPFLTLFRACSGARIHNLYDGQWDENPQLDWLGPQTALTTVGIGGNDLEFADTLRDCIIKHLVFTACEGSYDDDITDRLIGLITHSGADRLNTLQRLYGEIRTRAPRARALVLGYPRFFPVDGGADFSSIIGRLFNPDRCETIRISDQIWINYKIRQFDTAIAASARSMGAEYVPTYDVGAGHELCGDGDEFMNRVLLPPNVVGSFHPNRLGHELLAGKVRETLENGPGGTNYEIHPGETIEDSFIVDVQQAILDIINMWPGSDVEMTLVSPSGRVIDRDTLADDVFHRNGPTSEIYHVQNPEPGRWTIRLYGADVDPDGERTTLDAFTEPRPNQDPTARLEVTKTGKRTIHVDAGQSADADGEVVDYLWDFHDGKLATGRTATHTYDGPGTFRVTLVVKDDRDGLGFATAEQDFEITPYPFAGFFSPVNSQPTVNTVNAGRAIPVKFSLGGDEGLDIFDPGSPRSRRIDCDSGAPTDEVEETSTPGASTLTYDVGSGRYHYVWKTEAVWAGTCRRLELGLNDGSTHAADFRFR
jgi:hypothetical protein